jgi:hypothetical protein
VSAAHAFDARSECVEWSPSLFLRVSRPVCVHSEPVYVFWVYSEPIVSVSRAVRGFWGYSEVVSVLRAFWLHSECCECILSVSGCVCVHSEDAECVGTPRCHSECGTCIFLSPL